MEMSVVKLNHEEPAVRERIFAFLAPHEVYCLFIAGNLKQDYPGTHLYAVTQGDEWLGIAGYYEPYHSLTPFAVRPEATRALVRHIAQEHAKISYLNAIAAVAEAGYEVLQQLGYETAKEPRQVFMQLGSEPAAQPYEELVRPVVPADYEAVAKLNRYLRNRPQNLPVTEDELAIVRSNPLRRVLEVAGQVVATACTNGVGITAFQILAVVTEEAHRGKGYAKAVCASLIRLMRKAGARQTILFTGINNVVARKCYEHIGFRATGEYWVAELLKK